MADDAGQCASFSGRAAPEAKSQFGGEKGHAERATASDSPFGARFQQSSAWNPRI